MALDKTNKNYFYNVGRTVAIVEIMNELPETWRGKVCTNAYQNLPYQLKKALFNERHNLHKELLDPANVTLMEGELPKTLMSVEDKTGLFWIGYYHEKAYLADTYKGIFGKVETTIEEHVPERIDVPADTDNTIDDLKR